jgi:hypothetical protein
MYNSAVQRCDVLAFCGLAENNSIKRYVQETIDVFCTHATAMRGVGSGRGWYEACNMWVNGII